MTSFGFGQSLPPAQDVFNEPDHENCKSLYATIILPAEAAAVRLLPTSDLARRDLVVLRLVGYLLIHYALFSPEAREPMEKAIASCNTYPNDVITRIKLCELGEFYFDHLIRPMKKSQGRTATPTSHLTRPSFDRSIDAIRENITPSSSRGGVKKKALVRDGYCCMVTGLPDLDYQLSVDDDDDDDRVLVTTQCCHIIPFSVNSFNDEREETFGYKFDGIAIFWGILKMFGYHLQPELAGDKINRLENVMTLSVSIHGLFDDLNFWLEEVEGKKDTYRTCLPSRIDNARRRKQLCLPPEVHFISHSVDNSEQALPDPRYLRLRAACCKVAHLSGAAEYLDEIYWDMDTIQVLAFDGSSAEVLDAALWRVAALVPPV
ncbi:hypothetical protein C8Q74DRAFT_1451960 [Fomes fomentarius]|nr:hypothetical protein C8Q74DRAFT_1451960 [Fomes fomentarius]